MLYGVVSGEIANIVCNECGQVVRTTQTADLQRTMDAMENTLEVASEMCSHCGAVNLFPGFSKMLVFRCTNCGEMTVTVEDR